MPSLIAAAILFSLRFADYFFQMPLMLISVMRRRRRRRSMRVMN